MDRKKWVKAWIDEEGGGCRGGGSARLMVPPLPNGRDRTQLWVYWLGGGRVSPNRPGPDITPANSKLPAITLTVTKNTECTEHGPSQCAK